MNTHSTDIGAIEVLKKWRNSASGEPVKAADLKRAFEAVGALVEDRAPPQRQSWHRLSERLRLSQSVLSVAYNGNSAQIHYTDTSFQHVKPPEGLIIYNMLNSILARH